VGVKQSTLFCATNSGQQDKRCSNQGAIAAQGDHSTCIAHRFCVLRNILFPVRSPSFGPHLSIQDE
jgi:hypothetical protein